MMNTIVDFIRLVERHAPLATVASCSVAALALFLNYFQLRKTVRWNKLNATLSLFSNDSYTAKDRAANLALGSLKIDLNQRDNPLSDDEVNKIIADNSCYTETKAFLNYLEDYATAVNTGILDSRTAFAIMATVIVRYHKIFQPLITKIRESRKRPRVWLEIEKLSMAWEPQLVAEENALLAARKEAQNRHDQQMKRAVNSTGAKKEYS